MPPVNTRATVVRALARREAELLQQPEASGHTLVAIIWEGNWIAARALENAGFPKGADQTIREQLVKLPSVQRGMGPAELIRESLRIAKRFGHDWVGTEHQLLAIMDDDSLSELIVSSEARLHVKDSVNEQLEAHARDQLRARDSTPDQTSPQGD